MNSNFLEDLRVFFAQKGITKADIARELGYKHSYVCNIINGKKNIGRNTAAKLSEAYGIDVSWLITCGDAGISPVTNDSRKVEGDNNNNFTLGDNSPVTSTSSDSGLKEIVMKYQEQIDRLITIIENMQKQ